MIYVEGIFPRSKWDSSCIPTPADSLVFSQNNTVATFKCGKSPDYDRCSNQHNLLHMMLPGTIGSKPEFWSSCELMVDPSWKPVYRASWATKFGVRINPNNYAVPPNQGFGVMIINNNLDFVGSGTSTDSDGGVQTNTIGRLERSAWIRITTRIKYSRDNDGLCEIYMNGVKIYSKYNYATTTMPASMGIYCRVGLYRWTIPFSASEDQIMHYRNMRIASTKAEAEGAYSPIPDDPKPPIPQEFGMERAFLIVGGSLILKEILKE